MSEHESIKKIVGELNHHKSNIVTAVKHFVNTSKDLGQKTKDKKIAENILVAAQKSEKYSTATIPDLIIAGGGPHTTGSVKIHHPTNGSQHLFDTDIKLDFETKHVHLPFTYVVVGKDSSGEFLIKSDKSPHEKVIIHNIMRNNKDRLSVGTYDISVYIINPATNTEIVPPDKINIEITPLGIGPETNIVEIISPSSALSPYNNSNIAVQFKVDGPYHASSKEYGYIILAKNTTTNTKLGAKYGRAKNKDITHATPLILSDGVWEIQIEIIDPSSSMTKISQSEIVTFVVDTKTGPTPSTNIVEIISPSSALSPYKTSDIAIQFKVDGPYHTSLKEYVYAISIRNTTTKKALPLKHGRAKNKNITLATPITLAEGVYEMLIKIIDSSSSSIKEISKSEIVTFVVDTRTGPTPGPIGPTVVNIINNIIINHGANNIFNIDSMPFLMPMYIKIEPNPAHIKEVISHPINIQIIVTKDGSSKVISVINDILTADLEQLLKNKIPFTEEGRYNLVIILHRDKKELIRRVVPVEIIDKNKGPTIKKGNAVFSVIVGSKDIKSGNSYTTEIKPGEKTIIKVKNSGDGGNLVWRANSDPWIKVTPRGSTKSMKKGSHEDIIVEIDVAELGKIKTKEDIKYGRVLIEGAYGTKINPEDWKTIAGKCLISFKLE